MKKKILCLVVIVIAFLICCIVYFKPLSLSDVVEDNNQIKMVYSELGVKNGEAYIDSVDYQDITIEQKSTILALLDKYTYRRTIGTLFSNGSTSDLGDKTLSVYVYDDVSLINSVFATSSGKIVINEKVYNMEKMYVLNGLNEVRLNSLTFISIHFYWQIGWVELIYK